MYARQRHDRRPLLAHGSLGALRSQGGSRIAYARQIEIVRRPVIIIAILRESHLRIPRIDHNSNKPHTSLPPKYAVSQVLGYIKGKSAIHLAPVYGEWKRNFIGQHFWARGYSVSTVGRGEAVIREYIRKQEQEDMRLDQLNLWR